MKLTAQFQTCPDRFWDVVTQTPNNQTQKSRLIIFAEPPSNKYFYLVQTDLPTEVFVYQHATSLPPFRLQDSCLSLNIHELARKSCSNQILEVCVKSININRHLNELTTERWQLHHILYTVDVNKTVSLFHINEVVVLFMSRTKHCHFGTNRVVSPREDYWIIVETPFTTNTSYSLKTMKVGLCQISFHANFHWIRARS